MKRLIFIAAACMLALPLHAQTIASVNGEAITQDKLDSFVALLVGQGATDSDELRTRVKQEMINRLVAVQAARKAGLDKNPEIVQEIELANQGILVRALMTDHLDRNPISDETLKAEYEKIRAEETKEPEYKVRHILVKEETEATALIADIKAGRQEFADAAGKASIDPGSGKNGGELGWAPAANYVPEFAEAVRTLGKGGMSETPVESQFGWHIILVEDERPATFPEFDDIRTQLEEMMRQQQLASFQQALLEKANITEN